MPRRYPLLPLQGGKYAVCDSCTNLTLRFLHIHIEWPLTLPDCRYSTPPHHVGANDSAVPAVGRASDASWRAAESPAEAAAANQDDMNADLPGNMAAEYMRRNSVDGETHLALTGHNAPENHSAWSKGVREHQEYVFMYWMPAIDMSL